MITRPLNLLSRLKKPSLRFDVVALFDILVIVFGFTLLSSRFIFAPGITIDLPRVAADDLVGVRTDAVLTIGANEMLLFEGSILNYDNFVERLGEHFQGDPDGSLLIRADRRIPMQTLLEVAELARSAGVARVQVAASPSYRPEDRDFLDTGRR